jgi:hypothetical protein
MTRMSRPSGAARVGTPPIGRDLPPPCPRTSVVRPGTRVALERLVRGLSVLIALPTLQACLITQHVQVDPPDNFPPAVADPLAPPPDYRPIGSHISLADLEPGDAGPPTSIAFEVAVRDPDVDQRLEYQVWVNYITGSPFALRGLLVPDDATDADRTTRLLRFDLPRASLIACNRVELRVTSSFQFVDPREPDIEGDLGTATWWIVSDRTVSLDECREAP